MKEKKSLKDSHPDLAIQAKGWNPKDYTSGSNANLEWMCSKGHVWLARIINRTAGKTGCPICAGKKVLPGLNDLATLFPEMAKEADGWDPKTVLAGSSKKVLWKCPQGHNWEVSPGSRTSYKTGCPVCAGRQVLAGFNDLHSLEPELSKQIVDIDPRTVTTGSNKRATWRCNLGHEWVAPIVNRAITKQGCPTCAGKIILPGFNDLQTTDPLLALEAHGWDPKTKARSSDSKAFWKCSLGHVFEARIANRTNRESGCPFCSGNEILVGFNDLLTTHPSIAAEADGWDPRSLSFGANTRVQWVCPEGHKWKTSVASRASTGSNCPTCSKGGFDPNKEAWLYLMEHEDWGLTQIGITNNPSQRLSRHTTRGWELLDILGPISGHTIQEMETDILAGIRKAIGLHGKKKNSWVGPDGSEADSKIGIESWITEKLKVSKIKELRKILDGFET